MASSIITPAHMEEKGKKIKVGYPQVAVPDTAPFERYIRLARDAKHLSRVCRLEGWGTSKIADEPPPENLMRKDRGRSD